MKNKDRIPTHQNQSPLDNNPFANLDISNINLTDERLLPAQKPSIPLSQSSTSIPLKKGRVDLRREKAGRGGKTVTVLEGITNPDDRRDLLKSLQKLCGCGGTIKGDAIEIQGDKRDEMEQALKDQGYRVVLSGG